MNATSILPATDRALEAAERARLSYFDIGLLCAIAAQAKAGVWWGCAERARAYGPMSNLRPIQNSLRRLEAEGFIRRFRSGRRGNYPVLIDGYHVTGGQHAGRRLNAAKSTDAHSLVYE